MTATRTALEGEKKATPPKTENQQLTIKELIKKHGEKHADDMLRGVTFCAKVWDFQKKNATSFHEFCLAHYTPPGKDRLTLLHRLDEFVNVVGGAFGVMSKEGRKGLDIADLPLTPADELLAAFSAGTHLSEDYRDFNIAALVQLNFGTDDLTPPKTRDGWAARRMSNLGREVIPAELLAEASKLRAEVDRFVSTFNIHLDKILFEDPSIKFPKDTVHVSHWGLRDYMTGLNNQEDPLPRQRAIRDLLRRVVDGQTPLQIIDNSRAQWNQKTNTVVIDGVSERAEMSGAVRWENFKKLFDIARKIDPHTRHGNIIDNKFKLEREIPEEIVVKILIDILSAPAANGVAKFVESRLGRPLEPHDMYFKNFHGSTKKVRLPYDLGKRYPNAAALTKAIPDVLTKLGFPKKRAQWIGSKIRVDNSRSAGHAWGPHTPDDIQLLRVRVEKRGVTEQEFGTYMHELGHCVEGVLTSYEVDYKSLWGVPNTAFTEGFAFTFQDKADFVLGRKNTPDIDVTTLLRFWEVFEIAGPALVEIYFFHWLYSNPQATPEEMNREIRRIGDEVWADYYSRIFGAEGYGLLSVYSHILWCDFYLADYPMGYVIAYQVRKFLQKKNLAKEMERMCHVGSIYPEQWMRHAVGQGISVKPLLDDTRAALRRLKLAR